MNIPIFESVPPVYRCPDDGAITESVCCPKCGQVMGVQNEI